MRSPLAALRPRYDQGRVALVNLNREKTILSQVRKDKNVIYGGQAVKKHIGFVARSTTDYDIFSSSPRKSAVKLEHSLDRRAGSNVYYTKQAKHPGTYKVEFVGPDFKKGTDDDVGVADFTKPSRVMKTRTIDGLRYVKLSETVKDKKQSIRDPTYSFRHEKDKEDLRRIKLAQEYKIGRR